MSEAERQIAEKIWPAQMRQPDRYEKRVEAAKQWLGKRYLLAEPQRKRK